MDGTLAGISTSDLIMAIPAAIAAIATVTIAILSFKSARAAARTVEATAKATEAQLVSLFLGEYSSYEMSEAIQKVKDWASDQENSEWLEGVSELKIEEFGEHAPFRLRPD